MLGYTLFFSLQNKNIFPNILTSIISFNTFNTFCIIVRLISLPFQKLVFLWVFFITGTNTEPPYDTTCGEVAAYSDHMIRYGRRMIREI